MILFSHPTGNSNVREALRALSDAGLLSEFWTCINWSPKSPLNSILPARVRQELERRSFPDLVSARSHAHPWYEVGRLLATRFGLKPLVAHEVGRFCVDAVYRQLDRRVAQRLSCSPVSGVYAYEDGALETFRLARNMGVRRFYELPTGHWKARLQIMSEEAEREPEWAVTIPGREDSIAKLMNKDEELSLADCIIVPSAFVRHTLEQYAQVHCPVHVIPYGAPPVFMRGNRKGSGHKLKVLFVGRLRQSKGLSYLFKALDHCGTLCDATFIGPGFAGCPALRSALQKHRWIRPLPHSALLREMREHDVLVLPTLFEGFALVILEAMSQGLPVITTPNSGANGVIENGIDGFVVPIRSAEGIAEKLQLLARDRAHLHAMSEQAQQKATQQSWEAYRAHLAAVVAEASEA